MNDDIIKVLIISLYLTDSIREILLFLFIYWDQRLHGIDNLFKYLGHCEAELK